MVQKSQPEYSPTYKGSIRTPLGTMYPPRRSLGTDTSETLNLDVMVARAISSSPVHRKFVEVLKRAGLYAPKPRKTEIRPYKNYGDLILRNIGKSRYIRDRMIAAVAHESEKMQDPSYGLSLLSYVLEEYKAESTVESTFYSQKIELSGDEITDVLQRATKLRKEIQAGDDLAISVGKSFNQFLQWFQDNKDLAMCGFRRIEGITLSLGEKRPLQLSAGLVDLVTFDIRRGSKLTPEVLEQYIALIDGAKNGRSVISLEAVMAMSQDEQAALVAQINQKHRGSKKPRSGVSFQQLLNDPTLHALVASGEVGVRLVDFKQRTVEPTVQTRRAEEVQLMKYYVASFPRLCRQPGENIRIKGLHLGAEIARHVGAEILELQEGTYTLREIVVPDRMAHVLNGGDIGKLYEELHAYEYWKQLRKEGLKDFFEVADESAFETNTLPDRINPENIRFEDALVKIIARTPQRIEEERELFSDLVSGATQRFEKYNQSWDSKDTNIVILTSLYKLNRKLLDGISYTDFSTIIEELGNLSTHMKQLEKELFQDIQELHLRYLEKLENKYHELAHFRSVVESATKTGNISFYDVMLLLYSNITEDSKVNKPLTRHPDGTIVVSMELPNMQKPFALIIPYNRNYIYLCQSEDPGRLIDVIKRHNGPPYSAFDGSAFRHAKVFVHQYDKELIEPVNIIRMLSFLYQFTERVDVPFVVGNYLDTLKKDGLYRVLFDTISQREPSSKRLRELGLPPVLLNRLENVRFSLQDDGEGIELLRQQHFTAEELVQLGVLPPTASIFNEKPVRFPTDRMIVQLKSIRPLKDTKGLRSLPIIGLALRPFQTAATVSHRTKSIIWQSKSEGTSSESGFFQIGDLSTSRSVIVAGNILDAITLHIMARIGGVSTGKTCILAPAEQNYGALAADVATIRKNFPSIEHIEVLRGQWATNILQATLERAPTQGLIKNKEISVTFWQLVKNAASLFLSGVGIRSHTTVSGAWQELLKKTQAHVRDDAITWENEETERSVIRFLRSVLNPLCY